MYNFLKTLELNYLTGYLDHILGVLALWLLKEKIYLLCI